MDGTRNKQGTITSFIDLNLKINNQTMNTRLLVTGLGKQKVILGFPWLNKQNPNIDWATGMLTWRIDTPRRFVKIKRNQAMVTRKQILPKPSLMEEEDKDKPGAIGGATKRRKREMQIFFKLVKIIYRKKEEIEKSYERKEITHRRGHWWC